MNFLFRVLLWLFHIKRDLLVAAEAHGPTLAGRGGLSLPARLAADGPQGIAQVPPATPGLMAMRRSPLPLPSLRRDRGGCDNLAHDARLRRSMGAPPILAKTSSTGSRWPRAQPAGRSELKHRTSQPIPPTRIPRTPG
ncbi:hypothetical protein JCM7686_3039 [Paracoccus aminophilus JCM 7686]|uniref:Uncharacterized protein n=1 Tax=Paracoccus aminophilus JCM 7686 TaxID=1367847 RepID=S5Y2W3_PARAH|nr:hypothetical protein JCM7686_3039 [Paracoccus aminophilus JCM 7686]